MGISHPVCTARLMRPTAFDAVLGGQNCLAYSMMFSMNPSRSKMSLTMPSSCASSNEKVLPVTMSSMALLLPTMRERRWVPPVPGDPGVTIGAAWLFGHLAGAARGAPMTHAFYCGLPPVQSDIAAALKADDIASQRIGDISTDAGRDAITTPASTST